MRLWKVSEASQELDAPLAEQLQEVDRSMTVQGVKHSPILSALFGMAGEAEPQGAAELIKGNF